MQAQIAAQKTTSLHASLRYLVIALTDIDEVDCMVMLYHLFRCFREGFAKLCIGTHTTPLHLTSEQFSEQWSKHIDRRVIAGLGDGAGSISPWKKAGAMHDAVTQECTACLKARKQTELTSMVDVLDIFASKRLDAWWNNFLTEMSVQNAHNKNAVNDLNLRQRKDFLVALIVSFFAEWASLYRSNGSRKFHADASDYRDILLNGTVVFSQMYLYVTGQHQHKIQRLAANHTSKTTAALATAEQTIQHRACISKMETFIASHGGDGKSGSGAGNESWKDKSNSEAVSQSAEVRRRCKAGDSCCELDTEITPHAKFVLTRCSEGCVQSWHPACYRANAPDMDAEDVPCINVAGCSGHLFRIVMMKDKEILAELLGGVIENEHELDQDDGEAAPVDASDAADAAARPSRAGKIIRVPTGILHRADRYDIDENGLLVWKDAAVRAEKRKQKAEKRERDAEKAKQKAAAERENPKKDDVASSAAEVKPSSHPGIAKKPLFEVVVPLAPKQPGESSSPTLPPTRSTLSSASSLTVKNAFRDMNLDSGSRDQVPVYTQRNAWLDYEHGRLESKQTEIESLFPITVKVKKGKLRQKAKQEWDENEDKELQRALKASLQPLQTTAQALFGRAPPASNEFPGLSASIGSKAASDPSAATSATPIKAALIPSSATVLAKSNGAATIDPETPSLSSDVFPSTPGAALQPSSSYLASNSTPMLQPSQLQLRGEGEGEEGGAEGQPGSGIPSPVSSTVSSVGSRSVSPAMPLQQAMFSTQKAIALPIGSSRATALPIASGIPSAASPGQFPSFGAESSRSDHASAERRPVAAAVLFRCTHNRKGCRCSPLLQLPTSLFACMTQRQVHHCLLHPFLSRLHHPRLLLLLLHPSLAPSPAAVTPAATAPQPAAPVSAFTKLDVVDSISASEVPTNVILLRCLPACVTIQHLGSLFCAFGKVQVRTFFTVAHGLCGIITYQTIDAAARANQAMTRTDVRAADNKRGDRGGRDGASHIRMRICCHARQTREATHDHATTHCSSSAALSNICCSEC